MVWQLMNINKIEDQKIQDCVSNVILHDVDDEHYELHIK